MNAATSANLDWKLIWQAVEDERIARGWTKRDLYSHAGVSHTAYYEMQHGKALHRADKISSLCKALGWSPEDLEQIGLGGAAPTVAAGATPSSGIEEQIEYLRDQVHAIQDMILDLNQRVRLNSENIGQLQLALDA